jgi:hypothetical protein
MFQGLQKWPETEEFSKLIATMSNVRIGKILNYTEAAVRKKTKKARNLKVFHFTYSRNPFSQGIGLCYLKQLPSLEAWRSQMGSEAKWGQEAKWRSQMGSKPNGVRSQMGSEYQDKKWYFFRPSKLRRLRLLLMYSSFLNAFELESMRARERGLDFHLLWGSGPLR